MIVIHRLAALVLVTLLGCSLSVAPAAATVVARHTGVQVPSPGTQSGSPVATATLTQCVTTGAESEHSLTVAEQMTLVPGSTRMQTRTYLVQRRSGEAQFHMTAAPGLGSWLEAEAGVKTYKDLHEVTNLAASAVYRVVVDFRWLTPHGHVLKRMQLNTSKCVQPPPSSSSSPAALGQTPPAISPALPAGSS